MAPKGSSFLKYDFINLYLLKLMKSSFTDLSHSIIVTIQLTQFCTVTQHNIVLYKVRGFKNRNTKIKSNLIKHNGMKNGTAGSPKSKTMKTLCQIWDCLHCSHCFRDRIQFFMLSFTDDNLFNCWKLKQYIILQNIYMYNEKTSTVIAKN